MQGSSDSLYLHRSNVPPPISSHKSEEITTSSQIREIERSAKGTKWNAKALSFFDEVDVKLEKSVGTFKIQKLLDQVGKKIDDLLANPHAKKLNNWIDRGDHKQWYEGLGKFVLKLPFKAARNILRLVYNLVKAAAYAFVHPLKALNNLGRFLIQFLDALTKPETYTKIGAGMLGASLGQVAVTGGFGLHAYVGIGLGGGLMLSGIAAGAILELSRAEKGKGLDAAKAELWKQLKTVPEFLLTGFVLGVIFGAISKAAEKHGTTHTTQQTVDTSNAQGYVNNQFLPQNNLPPPTSVTVDPSGNIIISYKGPQLSTLIGSHNEFYNTMAGAHIQPNVNYFEIQLHPTPLGEWARAGFTTNVETLTAGANWSSVSTSGNLPYSFPQGAAATTVNTVVTHATTTAPYIPGEATLLTENLP